MNKLNGMILAGGMVLLWNCVSMNKIVNSEFEAMKSQPVTMSAKAVTHEDIAAYPEPLQRYLVYTKVVGQPRIVATELTQTGEIRTKENQSFFPMDAKQLFRYDYREFIWIANMHMAMGVKIRGRDKYIDGHGEMWIRAPFFNIGRETGNKLDQGDLTRYFSELIWGPSAFLDAGITYRAVSDSVFHGEMTVDEVTATADFYVNECGQIEKIIFEERFMSGNPLPQRWMVSGTDYKESDGYMIPRTGKAVWLLNSGEFCYIKLQITEIHFNHASE